MEGMIEAVEITSFEITFWVRIFATNDSYASLTFALENFSLYLRNIL